MTTPHGFRSLRRATIELEVGKENSTITGKWLRVLAAFASMTLLLVVLRAGVFSTARAGTNAVIASDSFNRTVSNGWGTADLGGSWTVLDTPANWSVAPGQAASTSQPTRRIAAYSAA